MLAAIARSQLTDGVTLVGSGGLKAVLPLLTSKVGFENRPLSIEKPVMLRLCICCPNQRLLGVKGGLRRCSFVAKTDISIKTLCTVRTCPFSIPSLLLRQGTPENQSTREAAMEVVRAMVTQHGVTRRGHLVRLLQNTASILGMHLKEG